MKIKEIEQKAKEFASVLVAEDQVQQPLIDLLTTAMYWALSHQWVSVEDELPEEDESVIVLTLDDEVILARFIDGEFMFNQLWNIEPTHWMPIPPLAEEGGEDD